MAVVFVLLETIVISILTGDTDFPLIIEPETEFEYPEHLKVMTYEMNSEYDKFPEPKRCTTGEFLFPLFFFILLKKVHS